MRNLLLVCFISLFFAGTAYAEHLTIGDTEIPYSVPQGYILAGESLRQLGAKVFPENLHLLALYIEEEDYKEFLDGKRTDFNNYFLLCTVNDIKYQKLSIREFASLKKMFTKNQMKTSLEDLNGNYIPIQPTNEGIIIKNTHFKNLANFDNTDTSISLISISEKLIPFSEQQHVDKLAAILTVILTKGKVLFIYQYHKIDPSKDIFTQIEMSKKSAQHVLENLNIPHGTPKVSIWDKILNKMFSGIIWGLVTGAIIFFIKKILCGYV